MRLESTDIVINGVCMSYGAARSVEECGVDVAADVARLRAGLSEADLLAECLDGADEDRWDSWHEYVEAVALAAALGVPVLAQQEDER